MPIVKIVFGLSFIYLTISCGSDHQQRRAAPAAGAESGSLALDGEDREDGEEFLGLACNKVKTSSNTANTPARLALVRGNASCTQVKGFEELEVNLSLICARLPINSYVGDTDLYPVVKVRTAEGVQCYHAYAADNTHKRYSLCKR